MSQENQVMFYPRVTGEYKNQLEMPDGFTGRISDSPLFEKREGFKFTFRRFKNAIVKHGSIKIGSISEYRQIEKSTLRDKYEGLAAYKINDEIHLTSESPYNSRLARQIKITNPNAVVKLGGGLEIMEDMGDHYIFCFSYLCTNKVLDSFSDQPPYDSVVRIPNVFSLAADVVTYHPILKDYYWLCYPIVYCDRIRSHEAPEIHPIENLFEKDTAFSDNAEGRIVFIPRANTPSVSRQLARLQPYSDRRIASHFVKHSLPAR